MRTKTYDFRSFCYGDLVRTDRREIDRLIGHIKEHPQVYTALVYAVAVLTIPGSASAADPFASHRGSGGFKLIKLLQGAAFWAGMFVSIWGIIEAQLDFPGWKGRILKGVLGYIGILLIPLIFMELRDNLQADVWSQIEQEPPQTPAGGSGQSARTY